MQYWYTCNQWEENLQVAKRVVHMFWMQYNMTTWVWNFINKQGYHKIKCISLPLSILFTPLHIIHVNQLYRVEGGAKGEGVIDMTNTFGIIRHCVLFTSVNQFLILACFCKFEWNISYRSKSYDESPRFEQLVDQSFPQGTHNEPEGTSVYHSFRWALKSLTPS